MTQAITIRSLRPNVTRDEAIRQFTAARLSSWVWKLRAGSLQNIAEAYIPFRLYRVRFPVRGVQRTHLFAMDAVDGSLDIFEFAKPPGEAETFEISCRNHLPLTLPEHRAEQLLRDKVLRLVFQQGFFKLREVQLQIELLPGTVHLPYWLGFYGSPQSLRCRVLDAVRRRVEGGKASALFEHWLAA